MKLDEILKDINLLSTEGRTDIDVEGVNIDSRLIRQSHLFIALKGTQTDGHAYIDKAIELGANAILCENMPNNKKEDVTYITVKSTTDVVGKVASRFYGEPSTKVKLKFLTSGSAGIVSSSSFETSSNSYSVIVA